MTTTHNPNPFDSINTQLVELKIEVSRIASAIGAEPKRNERFLTIKQAAEILNVAEITLYRKTQSGEIPVKKIGARSLIPASFFDK